MPPRAVTQPLNGFTDSHCLWGEFFQALIVRDMKTASKAKKKAERGQRRLHKAMKTGELPPWSPTMFATEDGERWTLKDKFDPRVQQSWLRYIGYRIFE
jgi:oxysterol-binding protein-related protein 8